jgi:hypothetical protein
LAAGCRTRRAECGAQTGRDETPPQTCGKTLNNPHIITHLLHFPLIHTIHSHC